MSPDGPAASLGAPAPRTTFSVQFDDGTPAFRAGPDQPLLHAAAQAGIDLPSSCRNGSCRTCMCRLVSGRVSYRIAWPGLLAEEKAEGWILACIAYAESDLVLSRGAPPKDWRDQVLPAV